MGQYYVIVNVDKEEYLHPHKFGEGLKLQEFGPGGDGIMFALAALLADGDGRGGGDLFITSTEEDFSFDENNYQRFPMSEDEYLYVHKLFGSWAGDRIVIAGDYADQNYIPIVDTELRETGDGNLYDYVQNPESNYKDISMEIIQAITEAMASWIFPEPRVQDEVLKQNGL